MARRTWLLVVIAVVVASGVAIAPGAKGAAGDWTKIMTPKGPGQSIEPFRDGMTGDTLTVSGVVSTTLDPGTVTLDFRCFQNSNSAPSYPLNSAPVAISANHGFTATIRRPIDVCVLRAIPSTYDGIAMVGGSLANTGYVGNFAGPSYYPQTVANYPTFNAVRGSSPHALTSVQSPADLAMWLILPVNDSAKSYGPPALDPALRLAGDSVPLTGSSTRSAIRVDGRDAYMPYTLLGIASNAAAVPHEGYAAKLHPDGTFTTTMTDPLRSCQNPSYPQPAASCVMQPTGVQLVRTYDVTGGDQVATVRDRFISTDGKTHALDVQYYNATVPGGGGGQAGWMKPGASSFSVPPTGAVGGLPAAPATLLMTDDLHAADGDRTIAGVSYSTRPSMAAVPLGSAFAFAWSYRRTIGPSAPLSLGFGEEATFRLADTRTLASLERSALSEHLVITRPHARVHRRKVRIAGRITNPVNGLPRSVSVRVGSRLRTVRVSSAGAWSVKMRVSKGRHKVVVSFTDPGGVHHSAVRRFRRR